MRKKARRLQYAGIVFLLLFAVLYTKEEITTSGNESSRFAVVQALGEQGVFHIEHTNFGSTVDRTGRDGHIYSDKPLPLSVCAAAVHGAIHRITGINFTQNRMLAIYLVNLIFSGGCSILLFLLMFNHLRRTSPGRLELKWLLALAMCLTTWLGSYSVVLNNHTPAALAVLCMIVALEKYRKKPTLKAACFAALSAGAAGALDIPTGFFCGIAALAGIALQSPAGNRAKPLLAAIASGGAVALSVLALNLIAYGTPAPLYVAGNTGTFGIKLGVTPDYWFQTLLGFRGLFSYQPFLLLVFPAAWLLRRKLRVSDWCGLGTALAVTVFYLTFTNEYGGASYGFRYLIPVIPALWLVISRWILSWKPAAWKTAPVAILLLWGAVTSLLGAYCPFCVANAAHRTPQGHFSQVIRSPFLGNLLVMSFERDPEGNMTRRLIDSIGDDEACFRHLYVSALHMRNPELVVQLLQSSLAKKLGVSR